MSIMDKQDIKDLLIAARGTRNYCMLTGRGAEKTDVLIDALAPFDGNLEDITPLQLVSLRKAMRDVCQDIDDYTLKKIIEGDSPIRMGASQTFAESLTENGQDGVRPSIVKIFRAWINRYWPAFWQRAILPAMAVGFLVLAMHYTHWTFNANVLLTRLDEHLDTDVYEEIRDLIVVANAIEKASANTGTPASNLPSQKLFSQTMNKLKNYHYREAKLRGESITAVDSFNAIAALRERLVALPGTVTGGSVGFVETPADDTVMASTSIEVQESEVAMLSPGDDLSNKLDAVDAGVSGDDVSITNTAQTESKGIPIAASSPASAQNWTEPVSAAIEKDARFLEIVQIFSQRTYRHPDISEDYVGTRSSLLQTARELAEKISIANRFALPMIYGSLGAALFCLVRVLTPSLSDLGPARAFLRILFGAFAAMTLSMLFIPANIFTINDQSNPTLIFLACFLFGYSFDAVLAALRRMETFFQERLQPNNPG